MAAVQTALARPVSDVVRRAAGVAATAVAVVLGGAALAVVLAGRPPSLAATVAVGTGLLAVLALALARYDAAVLLGALLLGVVFVEPAPPDAIFAVLIAVAVATGRFHVDRVPLTVGALLGIFLALNLLSAVFAVDPDLMARFFLITLYLAVFGLWVTSYVDSTGRARVLALGLIAGGAVSSVLGTLALFVSFPGAEHLEVAGRAKALFADPNVFGPFLIVPALLVASELLYPRLLALRQSLKLALFAALGLGVLFAYSRAAWLNAAIAFFTLFVVYSLRRRGGRKVFRLLVVFVTAVAVLVVTLAVTGSVDFLQERARLQTYDVERFGAQQSGVALVAQYPFGVGPGQFEQFVEISAHSLYVRVLAEQGILGLVVVLGLVLATLALATWNAIRGRDTYGIGSAPLLAAWTGLVANSAFVDTLHWRHLWLVAGLIWAGTMRPVRRAVVP